MLVQIRLSELKCHENKLLLSSKRKIVIAVLFGDFAIGKFALRTLSSIIVFLNIGWISKYQNSIFEFESYFIDDTDQADFCSSEQTYNLLCEI